MDEAAYSEQKKKGTDGDSNQNAGGGDGQPVSGSGSGTLSASELALCDVNSYKDKDLISDLKVLEASEHARLLGLEKCGQMDAIFMKVIERKLDILQWEMFQSYQSGTESIILNVSDKKNFVKVKVPHADRLVLPFVGSVTATSSGSKPLPFCDLFGVKFYIQSKSDGLNSDIVVPSWSAKPVTKACEAYFTQKTIEVDFLITIGPCRNPSAINLRLVTNEEQKKEVMAEMDQLVSIGGAYCVSVLGIVIFFNECLVQID